ncbi:MAG: tetratricopeptide repeat protein, partial [Thermodesulfovibrio sp.]
KLTEAEKILKRIISINPKQINAFLNLATVYLKQKNLKEALNIYDEILQFADNVPEIYIYATETAMDLKDYQKAKQYIEKALNKFPDNADINFTAGVVFDKLGRFEETEKLMKKVISLNPEHAEALNYLGYSYADRGINLKESLSMIEKAVKLKPNNGYYLDSLGWVYFKLGDNKNALKYLIEAIKYVKDDPVILEHLGDVYKELGNFKEALQSWQEALKHNEKEEGLKERVEKKIKEIQPLIK